MGKLGRIFGSQAGFVLAAVLACGLASCAGAAADPPNLNELKAFRAYAVFYPGQVVDGARLSRVVKEDQGSSGGRNARWDLFYGDCTPPGGDSGCAPPLEVQNYSTCRRWADIYPGRPHLFNLRGAKAAWVRSAGSLEVYTGRTTVVIFANHRRVARLASRLLRSARQDHPPARLRPPAPGSLWGKLPCQRKPG